MTELITENKFKIGEEAIFGEGILNQKCKIVNIENNKYDILALNNNDRIFIFKQISENNLKKISEDNL